MSSKPSLSSTRATRPHWSLAFRLTAAYSLAGLLLLLLGTTSLYFVLRTELERSTELFLADKLNVLRTMLRERPDDHDALEEEIELESAARRYQQFYIRLLNQNGTPILTTPGMADQLNLNELANLTRDHFGRSISMLGSSGHGFRVASASAEVGKPSTRRDTVQIAIDISQEEDLLERYRFWFWGVLAVTSILFPVVGYWVARHGIRPVEEIAATARRITSTNLRERLGAEGYPSELASLAETFNQMLDRLEESFERISRFSADIAHDLRTPVHNIRGEAEVALARTRGAEEYREVISSCLEEAVRLSDLIGDLLFLGRAESPLTHLRREPVDVQELLGGVKEYYEASAADGGVSLTTIGADKPVVAELDRTLLQRAVGNLVSNALAHTPRGGAVVLGTSVNLMSKDSSTICIEVSDTGAGIPAEALPRVFDRFFRVDSSRSQGSGHGIGS